MDFKPNTRKIGRSAGKFGNRNTQLGHHLQFYKIPPIGEISLQEFEEYAVDRLRG